MVIVLKKRGKNSKMKMVISSKNTNKYAKEERKMIIMDLKIDNFLAFKNFHMNMSYPKKIVDSYINHEYLQERTNFRYKKVNILMGGNATGKTSIGKVLMCICNFIKNKGRWNRVRNSIPPAFSNLRYWRREGNYSTIATSPIFSTSFFGSCAG